MKNPKISVIMSVYNDESTLENAINSILKQSYQNFEFIIINDGSMDNSKKIINSKKSKKIKFYSYSNNRGLAARLNFAISKCSGSYIARMDADDISHKNRLLVQLNFFKQNPNFDVVGSNAIYRNENNKLIKKTNLILNEKIIKQLILFRNPFIHSTLMIKKNFFKTNLYNKKFMRCQDYELWIRSIEKFKFTNMRAYLVTRMEKNNFSLRSLYFSILARFYHCKLGNVLAIVLFSMIEILYFYKEQLKKIFS